MPHPLTHGIDTFFRERTAARRRVATVLLVLSGLLLTGMPFGRRIARSAHLLDVKRFGFAGPEQRVDVIRLDEPSPQDSPGLFGVAYLTTAAKKGGKSAERLTKDPNAEVTSKKPPE